MEMENCVQKLSKEIKCRDSLIELLYSLLMDDPMLPSIFIYGHVACGKSLVIEKLLNYLNYNISIINCLEHTSNRSLFEKIIVDLTSYILCAANNYKLEKSCDDFVEFIIQLKSIAEKNPKPIVIVLEQCDRLRNSKANLLPALLRLAELSQINVCTIFISDIIWEKYRTKEGMYEPITVHFPQYTREEMIKILLFLMKSDDYTEMFYKTYLNLFLSVYFRFCRDLKELRYMAKKNFVKYVEPIEANLIAETDTTALWRNIVGTFKSNLEVIYLRVSKDDFNKQSLLENEFESTKKLALSFQLPFYAKYLLIAAYLASYNPPKEDKKLFTKEAGQKKKRKTKKTKDKVLTTFEGPRSFPLNRLLAIFCAISDSPIDLNAILLSQILTMCRLGLLTLQGQNNIDEPKYKCCISFDFAMIISKNVGFELKKYLYDYLD